MSSPKPLSKIMSRGMSTQKLTGPTRKGVSFPNCQVSWKKMPEAQLAELLRRDFKTLSVHLKKATALAAKDKSGHSDPYCVLSIGNRKLNSSVIKKTLNPVWDELFDFEVFDDDKKLTITCWDKDLFGKDFEGSCVIDFSTLVTGKATDMTIELIGTGTGALHLTLTLYNCGVEPTPEPAPVSPTTPTPNSLKREPSSASPVRNPKRERYVRLDRIGDGGQASVFKVKDQQDGTEKVMKQIICESADQATVALGEVWQVRDLKQDNIVSYEDLYLDEMDIVGTKKYLVCFIMPFYKNGDLMGYIKRRAKPQQKKYVPKDKVVTYITQLARGLEFIHKNHVMHRDIKPQNILCNDDYSSVAFCDFGLAKKAVHDVASTICGTGGYMSPEQIKGADDLERLKYTNAVDIFALGVVMYELMTLRIGVMHGDLIVAREDVHLANLKQELTMIYKDENLSDIVVSMLRLDPNKRPTATELIEKLSSL